MVDWLTEPIGEGEKERGISIWSSLLPCWLLITYRISRSQKPWRWLDLITGHDANRSTRPIEGSLAARLPSTDRMKGQNGFNVWLTERSELIDYLTVLNVGLLGLAVYLTCLTCGLNCWIYPCSINSYEDSISGTMVSRQVEWAEKLIPTWLEDWSCLFSLLDWTCGLSS